MDTLFLLSSHQIFLIIVLIFTVVLMLIIQYGKPDITLAILMARVTKIRGNKYTIEGLYGVYHLDYSLQLYEGFDVWRSAFMRGSKEYYGPIIFDDENKTFLPVNPNQKKSLYWVSDINQGVKSGVLKTPFVMTYYDRRESIVKGTE